jgi:uncharacterized protein
MGHNYCADGSKMRKGCCIEPQIRPVEAALAHSDRSPTQPRGPGFSARAVIGLGRAATRQPGWTLGVVALITALLLPSALRFDYDDDIIGFLPEGDPAVARFEEIGARFGGLSMGIVGLQADRGDIFSVPRLRLLRELTDGLQRLPGVASAMSLTGVPDLEVRDAKDGGEVAVIDQLVGALPDASAPDTAAFEAATRARVLSREHIRGTLVSHDGAAALLLVTVAPNQPIKPTADAIRAHVEAALARADVGLQVHFGGAPFVGAFIAQAARSDVARLSPWVCAAVVLIVLFTARSLLGALIAVGSVGLGVVWVMGLLSLAGRPLTLVSSSMPMLLVALGSAYSIHLLTRVLVELDAQPGDRRRAVTAALDCVGPPIAVAGLTSAIGFLSFQVMNIAPMREFGVWMAGGTVLLVALGVVVVSAACVVLPLRAREGDRTPVVAQRLIVGLSTGATRHPLLAGAVLASLLAGAAWRVPTTPQFMDMRAFFDADSEPVHSEDFLAEQLGGSVFLQIEVSGDLKHPAVLQQLAHLEDLARAEPLVTDVQSIVTPVVLATRGLTGEARIPPTAKALRAIAALIGDQPGLDKLVTPDWKHAALVVKLKRGRADAALALTRRLERAAGDGHRVMVPRSTLTEAQRNLEHAALAHRLAMILARLPGAPTPTAVAAQLIEGGATRLDSAIVTAAIQAQVDDELILLAPTHSARSLSAAVNARLQKGPLTEQRLYNAVFAAADAEERADPTALRRAVGFLHQNLLSAGRAQAVQRLSATVLAQTPTASSATRARAERALSVLFDPQVAVSAAADAPGILSTTVRVTGFPLVNEGVNRAVVDNQIRSLAAAVALVLLTLAVFFRSPLLALIAAAPAVVTLALVFGLMGALGIPIDVGTSMVASIAVGVGVDYAVHLVWRTAHDPHQAATLTATGWGILINAMEVTVGFGLLIFATLVPMRSVGLLTAAAMALAALTTLIFVPACLRWAAPRIHPRWSPP